MSDARWYNDSLQFPRLIVEIRATQDLDFQALCESMDLEEDDLDELFDRADRAWEGAKAQAFREEYPDGLRGDDLPD